MERRDYIDNEESAKRDDDDDDDDDNYHVGLDDDDDDDYKSTHIDKLKQLKDDTATHNFGGSSYKERYTAKLIDTHEDNTSIDYECHIYKRFEYIYEDLPREGIIFVNKPHSTDVWLPKAFREPIGLPDDMVPDIWKDLNPFLMSKAFREAGERATAATKKKEDEGSKGGMRGSGKKKVENTTTRGSSGDGSGTEL